MPRRCQKCIQAWGGFILAHGPLLHVMSSHSLVLVYLHLHHPIRTKGENKKVLFWKTSIIKMLQLPSSRSVFTFTDQRGNFFSELSDYLILRGRAMSMICDITHILEANHCFQFVVVSKGERNACNFKDLFSVIVLRSVGHVIKSDKENNVLQIKWNRSQGGTVGLQWLVDIKNTYERTCLWPETAANKNLISLYTWACIV